MISEIRGRTENHLKCIGHIQCFIANRNITLNMTEKMVPPPAQQLKSLLQLLLGAEVVCVPTLLLAAISCSGVETSIALATDHFVTVVLHSQDTKGWFNDTTTKTQHQVKG